MSNDNDYSWAVPKGMTPPVKASERICFGIRWFDSEEAADAYAAVVREQGLTYNGGWYHGMPCGRDRGFDMDSEGRRLYAVTC